MENSQMHFDLSSLIEYKINQRNDLAKYGDKHRGLIRIIDREIDILEQTCAYIALIERNHKISLYEAERKYFSLGIQSGIMKERTGRDHPIELFLR